MNWSIHRHLERKVANAFRLSGLVQVLQRQCPRAQHNYRRAVKSYLSPAEVKSGNPTRRESSGQTREGMRLQLFHDSFRARRELCHSCYTGHSKRVPATHFLDSNLLCIHSFTPPQNASIEMFWKDFLFK